MSASKTIQEIAESARQELANATDEASLEAWRIAHLGRRAGLTTFLRSLGELAPEERRQAGADANRLKKELEEALVVRRTQLEAERIERTVATGRKKVVRPAFRPR